MSDYVVGCVDMSRVFKLAISSRTVRGGYAAVDAPSVFLVFFGLWKLLGVHAFPADKRRTPNPVFLMPETNCMEKLSALVSMY